ncbi:MAG TPA: hypothetical protein VNV44_01230 [Solirubrobacteraceae bacterium]|jgi:hypothetical protein|nr:hypothetical protein [Solirubrobacteraceae bacterium]
MTRLADAWAALSRERRTAAVAAAALLVTMFLPWYGLQSLDPKTRAIYSHNISAFGDVSFVEAAIFLVAAGVLVLLFARAEGRRFNLPGGDGTIVALAGGWAGLLIFYRVFDRPNGNGYPVGIQWGFFLAFVAAGALAYAGLRIRAGERPPAPLRRRRPPPAAPASPGGGSAGRTGARAAPDAAHAAREPVPARAASVPAAQPETPPGETAQTSLIPIAVSRRRPRYPPAPGEAAVPARRGGSGAGEQLSFEDHPSAEER